MLRDAAVDLMLNRLGLRQGQTNLRDHAIAEMVLAQTNELEGNAWLPWFLLGSEQGITFTASASTQSFPSGWLALWEDWHPYWVDSAGARHFLVREDYDVALREYTGTGSPKVYDLVGDGQAQVFPTPDQDYIVYWRGYERDADISGSYGDGNNIENGWLKWAADLLVAKAGIAMAEQYLQSAKMAQLFKGQAQVAEARLYAKHVAMTEEGKQRYMEG